MKHLKGQYQQRLAALQLEPLELRRLYIDLIWVYKILNGLVDLNISDFFQFSGSQTRGHSKKLYPKLCSRWINSRLNFFSSRVVNIWNSLSDTVLNSASLSEFKRNLLKENLEPYLKFNRNLAQP